jgi:hypothetical protein
LPVEKQLERRDSFGEGELLREQLQIVAQRRSSATIWQGEVRWLFQLASGSSVEGSANPFIAV